MDVMIPPWVRPESPETIRIIDDATVAFQPAFGRGMTQRGIFADPRWGLRRRYRGLRSDEKAAILNALNESRGQLNTIRVTPHTPIRGSFASSELLTNNTFASGATGWSAFGSGSPTLSVSDRTLRLMLSASAIGADAGVSPNSSVSVTQYAPYVARMMLRQGRASAPYASHGVKIGSTAAASEYASVSQSDYGLIAAAGVPYATTVVPSFFSSLASGNLAGDYESIAYVSLARCALLDNGANLVLRSDDISNASWTKTRSSAVASSNAAPDGSLTDRRLVEDSTASNTHSVTQSITVSSSASDYAFTVCLKAGTRTWALLVLSDNVLGQIQCYFNLGTGAIGTPNTGSGWANLRTFVAPLGNSWYACTIVGQKTGSSTTLVPSVFLATGDGGSTYSGNGSSFVAIWRASLAASSVPTRQSQTTSAAVAAQAQSGSALYTKGWPASTTGLLLPGDWFEWQGELKQLTAPVNSDAAGLAYMQFRPSLAGSPADNDPIIVFEPFGRFIYPGTREFENLFGIYGDCEMNLEEVYS